jgi:sigma-B regulation protein RsbU (phosphoserine phosphatase)
LKIKNSLKLHEQQKIIKELNDQVETELRNANEFQNLMLPKSNEFKDLDLYIKYKPSIGIGGDFFDCTERGDELWFMIADVTGHGIVAAMISSMIKILFRSCVQYEMASPSQVLNKINKNVFDYIYEKDNISNIVFSAFVGKISEKTLFYSNAGQPYPVLYQDYRKEIVPLKGNGVNIGFFEESTYNEYQIKMNKDDMLLVYTDGLFSSGVNSDFADWPEVQYFCEDHIDLLKQDQNEFLNEILSHFAMKHRKNDSDYSDDIAIMLLKYK